MATAIAIIAACAGIVALVGVGNKEEEHRQVVYDYRINPEVLDEVSKH